MVVLRRMLNMESFIHKLDDYYRLIKARNVILLYAQHAHF